VVTCKVERDVIKEEYRKVSIIFWNTGLWHREHDADMIKPRYVEGMVNG
jgi:hypothetical protein